MKKSNLGLFAALAFAIGIIYFFNIKGIKFYLVPSDSMKPTLESSDYICGFKHDPSELQHGDIVVFTGDRKGEYYVKRVVGLPGENLAIFLGMVYINNRKFEESYVKNRGIENLDPIKIPEGRVFIMGDNRTNSIDSRKEGPISIGRIESKVSFIYNPIHRMGFVH